jgi:rubrerythrin
LTTVAHNADKAREIDADTNRAWSTYSERLRDLTGDEYESAEQESWSNLQGELRRLDRRRRTLNQTSV